jgi:hypothetical protein
LHALLYLIPITERSACKSRCKLVSVPSSWGLTTTLVLR